MNHYSYIFLLLYIIILVVAIKKIPFFESEIISKKNIILFAFVKMIVGIFYIYINKHHTNGGDIFLYLDDANIVFDQLTTYPINFLKLVFYPNNVEITNELAKPIYAMGFWGDNGSYMLVRFNALIRLISFNNMYINGVFSGFISFVGSFLIMKVFERNLKVNKIVLFSIFLTPSILLWSSGIHKEFISVFALGLILYNFFELLKRFNKPLNILFFGIGIILFFFTRNYMLLALIPSLFSWALYKTFHIRYTRAVYFSIVCLVAFLNFTKIPSYNKTGFEVIIEKRKQFENLKHGNTSIELDEIEATFLSLMKNSPKALFNTIARPHFGEIKNSYLLMASIESFMFGVLIVFAFFNFHKLTKKESNFIIFMLMYSISLLLIIGWIVPNIGAIVRYRSIALIIYVPTLLFVVSKNKYFKKLL